MPNQFTADELEKFKSCLSKFKVYLDDYKFEDGGEAFFKGHSDSRAHWYSLGAIGAFEVSTDQKTTTTTQLAYKKYGVIGGTTHLIRGYTDPNSPYLNYIGVDAVLQGREAIGLWVHELGNSLSAITNIELPVARDAADRYDGDTDQGTAFEDCVFGGHVTATGILPPKP